MSKLIKRKKPKLPELVRCPVCQRYHVPDCEFGPFCCASCLQTVIRPLIVAIPEK
jgi:hypothetical protein